MNVFFTYQIATNAILGQNSIFSDLAIDAIPFLSTADGHTVAQFYPPWFMLMLITDVDGGNV